MIPHPAPRPEARPAPPPPAAADTTTPEDGTADQGRVGRDDGHRYVLHLPVTAADQDRALRFAYALARSLVLVPGVEVAGATVSAEDAQHVRRWVFCDRIMPDRRRCLARADHDGPCDPDR